MKKITVVLFSLFVILIIYILLTRDSIVDYSTEHLEISSAPEYIQDWSLKINNTDNPKLCKETLKNKLIIYLYIPTLSLEKNEYKGYRTINIGPIKNEGIDIKITYKDYEVPKSTLIEIKINKPKIKYIKLNNQIIDINNITKISGS